MSWWLPIAITTAPTSNPRNASPSRPPVVPLRARPSPVFRRFSPMASREAAMGGTAAFRSSMYNAFFRRTSVYVTVCVAAAYASTEAYLAGTDRLWASINKGVRSDLLYSYRFLVPKILVPLTRHMTCCDGVAHGSNCPPESLTLRSTSARLYNTITQNALYFSFPSICRLAVAEIMGRGQSNTPPKGRGRRLVSKSLPLLVVCAFVESCSKRGCAIYTRAL
jgi:Ubiquinol-cytochrome C reductase, UQCRX/QCR9 like